MITIVWKAYVDDAVKICLSISSRLLIFIFNELLLVIYLGVKYEQEFQYI